MIQGHGDDIFNYPDIEINFSSNVNPNGTSPGLLAHLKQQIGCISSYPEPMAETLSGLIAQRRVLPNESVLVSNGAVEALYLSASLLHKKRSLVLVPSFAEYEDACKQFQHTIDFHKPEQDKIFPELTNYDAVWLGNPNNPDGKLYDKEILLHSIRKHPNTIFIVDEAYIDFTLNGKSLAKEATELPNLIVICSLTKRFAIPGIRLGYMISSTERIATIKKNLMPWRINALALACGEYCFSSKYKDNFSINAVLKESKRMQEVINEIPGFEVHPSKSIFFLIKAPEKASELKQILATKNKVLIRDASNFRGLSDSHFRVSARTPEENRLLINALKKWN